MDTQKWAQNTLARLEDMKHHHVVFTLPRKIRTIALYNQKIIHHLIFECAHFALIEWFKNKHQIKPGIVSVLHTFGSDLKYHPHVHMIVTAGGINEQKQIVTLPSYYLTRQRFLANIFKKRFILRFKQEVNKENIILSPSLQLKLRFSAFINQLHKEQWIVAIQKPLDDLIQIVGYVGRYTKRACISEYKIQSIDNDHIQFLVNDYQNSKRGEKPKSKIIKMHFVQFLDQLLQHVPDKKFRMVRYAGIYNAHYLKKDINQEIIKPNTSKEIEEIQILDIDDFLPYRNLVKQFDHDDPLICPNCKLAMTFDQILFRKYPFAINDS